jgi:hypothetical protein
MLTNEPNISKITGRINEANSFDSKKLATIDDGRKQNKGRATDQIHNLTLDISSNSTNANKSSSLTAKYVHFR